MRPTDGPTTADSSNGPENRPKKTLVGRCSALAIGAPRIGPRSLTTGYAWNGLDDQTAIASPDSGANARTFDAAGNVAGSTDARGLTTSYKYDALNRPTYADGRAVTWQYDQGTYGIGHLSCTTERYPPRSARRGVSGQRRTTARRTSGETASGADGADACSGEAHADGANARDREKRRAGLRASLTRPAP
jgi:YD repeat-containing protein